MVLTAQRRWQKFGVGLLWLACAGVAQAGFLDELVSKGTELVKGVGKAINRGPSEEAVLAQTPEQQDQTLIALYDAKDYDNVVRLATALHAKGSAVGTYFLGSCTLLGQGVALDKAKGIELIKQAAQAADVRAQATLGSLFAAGRKEAGLDPALGLRYLTAGAEKFDEAAEFLAAVYEEGLQGIPKDRAKALAIYKEHKWADATRWQSKITQLEAQLKAIPTESAFLAQTPQQQDKTLLDLQTSGDHTNVVKLANALLPSGSAVAKYYLAVAYLNGEGLAQDKIQGQTLVLEAADAGFKRAQMFAGAGLVYTKDEKLLDVPRGLRLLEASLPDFSESAIMLAEIHAKGDFGQPVNLPKALALYKTVQDPQYLAKIKPVIAALEEELKPLPTVAEMLAMSADQQDQTLGALQVKKKYADVMRLATALDEKGSAVGAFYVGLLHSNGRGVVQNEKLGAQYWLKAAAAGMHAAESNAGRGLLFAQWGFERDEALGVKYLQACYNYFNDCAYELGRAHQNGWGGLPKDKAKALAIFKNYKWNANYSMKPEIAKRIKELDPSEGSQELFVKYMEALKSVGLKVTDARTQGNSYYGEGTFNVNNGDVIVKFESEMIVPTSQGKPRLVMSLEVRRARDEYVYRPIARKIVVALEGKLGNLRNVFDENSTMIRQSW